MNNLKTPISLSDNPAERSSSTSNTPQQVAAKDQPFPRLLFAIVLLVSSALHLAGLATPSSVVFDEVHFGKFATAYCCTGERFFDIHPPHAKLLIAAAGKLGGYRGNFPFQAIGNSYGDTPIFALRVVPAFSGILLSAIIFILLMQLGASPAGAFFGALAVTLDNGLLVQTRIIALDGILLVGIFGALSAYLAAQNAVAYTRCIPLLILSGALCGLAVGTKFTGLTAIGLITWLALATALVEPSLANLVRQARCYLWVLAAAIAIYLLGWAIHFALLPAPGFGDGYYLPTGHFVADLVKLHQVMFWANYGLTVPHPDGSVWWSWPLMITPIFYWSKDNAAIYFLGNPVVWWGSALLFVAFVVNTGLSRITDMHLWPHGDPPRKFWIPCAGFAIALTPYIQVPRVLFMYHYLPPLLFSLLFVVLCLDRAGWTRPGGLRAQRRSYFVAIALVLSAFVLFAPLSYGSAFPAGYVDLFFKVFPGWR